MQIPSSVRGKVIVAKDLVEVTVCEHTRGDEGPHVQTDAHPAGTYLHPDSWPLALQVLVITVRTGKQKMQKYNNVFWSKT